MDVLSFRWRARYGHFLRAEANANALTYPIPPRPAVLGLLAAVLGLEKDALASELDGALVAVGGPVPQRFWHRVKLRKDPPLALPWRVRANQKVSDTAPEKATLLAQEWLLDPDFVVDVALPRDAARFAELAARLRERRWHYSPCMGPSELLADLELLGLDSAERVPEGPVEVHGVCLADSVRLRGGSGLGVHLLRMPRTVTTDRVFGHSAYYVEHRGRPIPVTTDAAWRVGERAVVFS